MKSDSFTPWILLIATLSQLRSSIEAYDVHSTKGQQRSSFPRKQLTDFSTILHSQLGKRRIHKQHRYSFWSNRYTNNTNYSNDKPEVEIRPRINAHDRNASLSSLLFQKITNHVPRMSQLPVILQKFAAQYWWSLPLTLCMVPVFFGPVSTPQFWKMVQVDYILECPDATLVIGAFLGSNLSYFLAGYRIFCDLPSRRRNRLFVCPYGGLAGWIWAAGLISTIFHAVQSMGQASLSYAEALYYIDHGIAGAAVFYFYHICGLPNWHATGLGMAGLLCLALPLRPGYAWLHSLWHVLSAAAAWMWTCQGKVARRKQLLSAVRDRCWSTRFQTHDYCGLLPRVYFFKASCLFLLGGRYVVFLINPGRSVLFVWKSVDIFLRHVRGESIVSP